MLNNLRLKAEIVFDGPQINQAIPLNAVSIPNVVGIGPAPKPTIHIALIPPKNMQQIKVTNPADTIPQSLFRSRAIRAVEKPSIDPIERSTTPLSNAKPANAPTIKGIIR